MRRNLSAGIATLMVLASVAHAETVVVGGAVVPVAQGWTQGAGDAGTVVLTPADLPKGTGCTFTLLGGEPFNGILKDRLASEWKEFEGIGRIVSDNGSKVTGAGGPVVTAEESGQVALKNGANVYVWLMIVSTNGRIERMVFVATTPDAFTTYGPAVSGMINGTQWVKPKAAEVAGAATGTTTGAPSATPAGGTPGKSFGHVAYTIPAGWRETRAEGAVVLAPPDLPKNESLEIVLLPPATPAGTLAEALGRAWDEGAAQSHFKTSRTVNNTAFNITQEQRVSFKGWPYIRGEGIMTAADAHDYFVALTVIKINNRLERVLVRSRQNELNFSRYSQIQNPDYNALIQQFIFSLQFDDWKEPKLQPGTLKGDGLVGSWWGVSMFGGKLHTANVLFFSNGQVFFGSRFPLQGCLELNTFLDSEETPRFWGTYEFANGKGALKMPYGDIPITASGNDLVFTTNNTPHTFIRLPSVDSVHLQGTYVFPEYQGKIPTLVFTADGHFDDRGALSQLRTDTSFPFSPTFLPGNGTYVVKDYTIVFTYADGRKFRLAFPGNGYDVRNPSPAILPVGYSDQEMKKQ